MAAVLDAMGWIDLILGRMVVTRGQNGVLSMVILDGIGQVGDGALHEEVEVQRRTDRP